MVSRKKLLIIIAILAIFALIGTLILILPGKKEEIPYEETLPPELFEKPDFEINILEDAEYLSLNRSISYCVGAVTYTVEPENYESTDKILAFIVDMTDKIIKGDAEGYADFFSNKYKNENSLPEKFSMQRLYNIKVEKISEGAVLEDDIQRTQYVYMLEYMINKNDGTFRRDIDSDSSRPQYLVITEREGRTEIDSIVTYIER